MQNARRFSTVAITRGKETHRVSLESSSHHHQSIVHGEIIHLCCVLSPFAAFGYIIQLQY
jgi:hypothetical protein